MELQFDLRPAGIGGGDHTLQAGNPGEILLLFDEDLFFDVLRRGSRPTGGYLDQAGIEIGNHLYRHAEHCQYAEQRQDQYRDGENDRLFDGETKHCRDGSYSPGCGCTVWSGRRFSLPRSTMRSPACSVLSSTST